MFTQFFEEWNHSIKCEHINTTKYNEQGTIVWQSGEIFFRDTKIQTHRKYDGQGGYVVELFVPRTNKFISNKRFATRAKCAAAILMALLPSNDKEDVRNQRAERRAEEMRKKITGERIEALRKLNLPKADFAWFCDVMNKNLQAGNSFHDDVLVDILTKFHDQLLCEKAYINTLPQRDQHCHMERLFEMVAMIRRKAIHTRDGEMILLPRDAARLFRTIPDPAYRLPEGICMVKTTFREIDNYLHGHTKKLIYVCQVLIDFYTYKTSKTQEQIIAAADERKMRAKERKLRQLEGLKDDGSYTVFGEPTVKEQRGHRNNKPPKQNNASKKPQKQRNQPNRQDPLDDGRPGMVSLANVIGSQLEGFALPEEPVSE